MTERGNRKLRIAVLFGGRSDEHDVSLRSAQTVIGALDPARYEVVPIGITRRGRWLSGGDPMTALTSVSPMFGGEDAASSETGEALGPLAVREQSAPMTLPPGATEGIDVVFPVLHGPMGEDGTVQGMLELAGVPYVGSTVLGSAVAMDKAIAKTILAQAGLPQLPWLTVLRKDWERDPATVEAWIGEKLGFPCFTKPANLGSSVGISKVHGPEELHGALAEAAHYDRKIVVERGVDAREIELAVLGNDGPMASVAGEIVPRSEFYDYNAKYVDDSAELHIPAKLDGDLLGYFQSLAIDAFRALDLAGMARVDFFLERETDHVYINEVNTIPGFTSISMYPMLWEASGVPLPVLVERLIELALDRHSERR
ncbi:MAG: D-alanine--D-alanine ligase [Chloroflexia bacterium]|nr:D-alanine--D-alanine ligase [Chloroflexia bacterium]